MIIFAAIVSVMMAFIRFDEKKDIIRYSCRLFLFMVLGVIVFSWLMRFF
jgi:hypothetical protein